MGKRGEWLEIQCLDLKTLINIMMAIPRIFERLAKCDFARTSFNFGRMKKRPGGIGIIRSFLYLVCQLLLSGNHGINSYILIDLHSFFRCFCTCCQKLSPGSSYWQIAGDTYSTVWRWGWSPTTLRFISFWNQTYKNKTMPSWMCRCVSHTWPRKAEVWNAYHPISPGSVFQHTGHAGSATKLHSQRHPKL